MTGGEAARNAWHRAHYDTAPVRPYGTLAPGERRRWEAVARAGSAPLRAAIEAEAQALEAEAAAVRPSGAVRVTTQVAQRLRAILEES